MNWLKDFVRPKVKHHQLKEIADNLWIKCPNCGTMIYNRELEKTYNVCNNCDHHMKVSQSKRFEMLFDNNEYKKIKVAKLKDDPLKFKDSKKYIDRLKAYRKKTGDQDVVSVATGNINGIKSVVACFNFAFIGGSMGIAVGEAIATAAEVAIKQKLPLVTISASGGARMQEGVLSLMQMAKTTAAITEVKENKLPYISIFTDPTAGGVTASFAMLGDVHIAEKGAIICFAGARVIEQTIREKLPEGFQTAEYLKEHGMIDIVTERKNLKTELSKVLGILLDKKPNNKLLEAKK
jgi:acetyl-CoA carboxylase carboxyl transferase subunit beta